MRKIEMFVEIQELNHQGDYVPVEIQPRPDVPSAGVFQLQQVNICMADETALVV
jgi:kinesin family protein 13